MAEDYEVLDWLEARVAEEAKAQDKRITEKAKADLAYKIYYNIFSEIREEV